MPRVNKIKNFSLNYSITLGGRYSSEYLDFAKIEISDC